MNILVKGSGRIERSRRHRSRQSQADKHQNCSEVRSRNSHASGSGPGVAALGKSGAMKMFGNSKKNFTAVQMSCLGVNHPPQSGCLSFGLAVKRRTSRANAVLALDERNGLTTMNPKIKMLTLSQESLNN